MFGIGKKPLPPPPAPVEQLLFGLPVYQSVCLLLCALHLVGFAVARSSGVKDPHLAGHFLPQLLGFIALAYQGSDWFFMTDAVEDIRAYYAPGERIAATMIGFQVYELLACIPSPRLRMGGLMIMHHTIAGGLAYFAYFYQVYHHYAIFYMGTIELSSLPLAFVDLFKYYPKLRTEWPAANEMARTLFAPCFLVLRTFMWPFVSFRFWQDSLAAQADPNCGVVNIIYLYQACNIPMTLLQWYWSTLIFKALYLKIIGDPKAKDA